MSGAPVLEVSGLCASVAQAAGARSLLRSVDLSVRAGETLGLVGESGGGKTMVGKAVLGVLPPAVKITSGAIRFKGRDLLALDARARRGLLGRSMSMILQNPMTALNPVLRIGDQLTDVLRAHLGMARAAANRRAVELLGTVHIRDPERVVRQFPHELSGGMCQRVVIAIAFACEPALVVADEPTTALDVTVQHRILQLIKEMQARAGTALLLVTHDMGVVAKTCDAVSVIYAGRILESAPAREVFASPAHPYTRALLAAAPRYDRPDQRLEPIAESLRNRLLLEAEQPGGSP
jgi:peptide/nickel transport system ATP-binding protein